MSAPQRMNKHVHAVNGTISEPTERQQKLLQMIEHGGVSRFIALVNSGSISGEEARLLAELYGQSRAANPSLLSRVWEFLSAK